MLHYTAPMLPALCFMNTEHLKSEIESVFSYVKKPRGLDLSFHKDECHQCGYLREDLDQYQEMELPPEGIREIHQEMSCLSPQGWRWALPSYLRYCVTEEAVRSQNEAEFLIYNLAPGEEYQADTRKRLSALNEQQIACLEHFLEWCQVHSYWGQYCSKEISEGIAFLSTVRA